jgi:hypothetical protein
MKRLILPASAVIAIVAGMSSAGHAQGFMPGQGGAIGPAPSVGPPPKAAGPKEAPPPALPGAASNAAGAAPATTAPADMEPTDALFDAINRGDIATARDAINRGADLNGRNVLGMTPMELSVDLGRNDISFLLLSMRGGDEGGPPRATIATTQPKPGKQAKASKPALATKVTATAQPVPSQTARLFSGDGGTPVPTAGFLGFDSARR